MYQYRFSGQILDALERHGVRCIVGNHDLSILRTPNHPLRDALAAEPSALSRLSAVPTELTVDLGGLRLAMYHGSPWDEPDRAYYVYPQDRANVERVSRVGADVIILGHTHIPFNLTAGGSLIVNPGSCGECRDGTATLTCSVVDTATREVELRRFPVLGG
jgi:predicted phosphodiesterase